MKPPKIFISILIDFLFVLFLKFLGVFFNGHFSQPTPFPILTYAPSPIPVIHLSLSLSLLPIPHSILPASVLYIKIVLKN
jgi:hypothetical protein